MNAKNPHELRQRIVELEKIKKQGPPSLDKVNKRIITAAQYTYRNSSKFTIKDAHDDIRKEMSTFLDEFCLYHSAVDEIEAIKLLFGKDVKTWRERLKDFMEL